jgi:hypothetical protein
MGTAFTIDSALKIARFGIVATASIGDDELCEIIREYYSKKYNLPYTFIDRKVEDHRAKRVTAFLNMTQDIIDSQIRDMRQQPFTDDSDATKYFTLLPKDNPNKALFEKFKKLAPSSPEYVALEKQLREAIIPGNIEVNIMTKVDKNNFAPDGTPLGENSSDAQAGLRGFANSRITGTIVLSAGFNRRLYAYADQLECFAPDKDGLVKKNLIIKVSDYRSALIQGRFFAKKGIRPYEFRVESGINCGGHTFIADGILMGPILQEFKDNIDELSKELIATSNEVLLSRGRKTYNPDQKVLVSVQGGIGTNAEASFMKRFYPVHATGWATPFLLVPEASTVDKDSLEILRKAGEEDLFLSHVSPLGIRFQLAKHTLSETEKEKKIAAGKTGSACPKRYLVNNTEYTEIPICTASLEYQKKKIAELESTLTGDALIAVKAAVTRKSCLCEDLAAAALVLYNIPSRRVQTPTVCAGPNLAYFDGIYSLKQMIQHIYGEVNLINHPARPHVFNKELKLYLDYYKEEFAGMLPTPDAKQIEYVERVNTNLSSGIAYYRELISKITEESKTQKATFLKDLAKNEVELQAMMSPFKQWLTAVN